MTTSTHSMHDDRLESATSDAASGGTSTAATVMGALTLLVGGAWWTMMAAFMATDGRVETLHPLLIPGTAVLTCIAFIVPTAMLTRRAHSRGNRTLWFNRFALGVVTSLMVSVISAALV